MVRPRKCKKIGVNPDITFYKPQGVPLKELQAVELAIEEWEALRLKHCEDFNQTESAEKMETSQSTFQRILSNAQKKVSTAIINGMAIKIIKK